MPLSPEQVQLLQNQIGGLEPLAGAGLAINLAYLALDRFRYRQAIEPAAEKQCRSNDDRAAFEEFHNLDPVRELNWLARRSNVSTLIPGGRGAFVYRYGFRQHQDVNFAIAASILCAFILAAGVASNIGRWDWLIYLMAKPLPGLMFYGCVASFTIPAISVALGRRCVTWGKNRIQACTQQVAIHLQALATQAQPPPGVPQGLAHPKITDATAEYMRRRREAQARRADY